MIRSGLQEIAKQWIQYIFIRHSYKNVHCFTLPYSLSLFLSLSLALSLSLSLSMTDKSKKTDESQKRTNLNNGLTVVSIQLNVIVDTFV